MADELTDFRWRIPSTGYQWVRAKTAPGEQLQATDRFLIAEALPGELTNVIEYTPLQERNALFVTFAEVDLSEPAIRSFANEFGWLGGDVAVDILMDRRDDLTSVGVPVTIGEPLTKWTAEILSMRRMMSLWNSLKKPDLAPLGRFIHWKDDDGVYYDSHPELPDNQVPAGRLRRWIAARQIKPDTFFRFQPGDILAPAWSLLQQIVDEKLVQHGVYARLLWNAEHTSLSRRMVPNNLAGCIWLQFAGAIEGKKDYRQCRNCRKWFQIGGDRGARADKKFCSLSCKATAHRKKREEALRLFSTDMPVKEIARRLDTDLNTVKGWLKNEGLSKKEK
jgi:hypothetical protein